MTLKVISIAHFDGLVRDLQVFQSKIGMFMACDTFVLQHIFNPSDQCVSNHGN